ncbi:MAG: hypothetical protein KAG34_06535 [Cocleimonas sp.]|nr:hypothetical protein [Cocleimonas sp.]
MPKKDLFILLTMWLSPAVILLLIISIYLVQPKVEAKLVSSVKLVLVEHNIDAEVSFLGRDGTLTGEVGSQEIADKAHRLSRAVFGIRVIRNQLLVRDQPYIRYGINNERQPPTIEKISYKTARQQQETDQTLSQVSDMVSEEKKPHDSADIEKIVSTIGQQAVPVIHRSENISSFIVPLDEESVESEEKYKNKISATKAVHISEKVKTPEKQIKHQPLPKNTNNLFNIIDDFNASLGAVADNKATDKKEESQSRSSFSQAIDKIDLSSIRFSNGSITLPITAHQVLDNVAKSIKRQSHPTIELIAYAKDSDIAYARGVSIREYLATQGINKNNVHVSGYTITDDKNNTATFKIRTYAD